ncbi:MAG: hypothetical protein V3V18_14370 [Methylococcales bacterium]
MQDNGRVAGASDVKSNAVQSAPDEKVTVDGEAAESAATPSTTKQEDWFTRLF